MLEPCNPATLDCFFQRSLVDIFHRHFFVRLCSCPQGSTQVGGSASGSGRRRIGTGITLQLCKQIARPWLSTLVIHNVGDNNIVQATFEGETLDVIDAVISEFQLDDQIVLAIVQLISLLWRRINRTTGSTCIRSVGTGQATLCQKSTLATIVEQLEWNIRAVLTTWIQGKTKLNHVTTYRIDRQIEHVGLDLNQVLARCDWRFQRRCDIGRCSTWNIGICRTISTSSRIRYSRCGCAGCNILGRHGSLAVVLVPFQNPDVGHDCQGDDQDRAFNIHDYSAIEEEREVGTGGTGS
ncbi:hypothetical protein PCH70_00010 [Pseudomonas cichorii JBC1]|nr:hypothetical protein PCH70_00010 [Pseudomonas cichorii JBC1]